MNEDRTDIPTTPVPPAPPAGSRWGVTPMMRRTKPELHINIFGIIGQNMQEIKDIITDTQSTFGGEYQLAFHVTFNPARYQSRQRAGKGAK